MKLSEQSMVGSGARSGLKSVVRATVIASCLISIAVLFRCGGGSSQQSILPLMITTASLPNGASEVTYSQTIQATGGVAPFTWTVSAGTLPHNLALSGSATNTVTISGTPDTAAQGVAFSVKVTDSANQSASQAYTVSILLEPDTLTLSSPSLSFAPQLIGVMSGAQGETISNTGTSAVVVSSIALTGASAADFSQSSSTCGSSLAAGANCTINVTFTPSQFGPRSASVTITDNTVGSPHSVSLSGVGLTSGPNATLSAASLTFATQLVGTTSPAQSIALSNYGTTTLSIAGITAIANFGETDNCGSSLASGASCTINVTFTPSASGSLNGTVSVSDNAPGSPQSVPLNGTGVAGSCTPQGGACGPGLPQCCAAPRGHHSFCSNPTGIGTCTES
jgi:trimeric autotransporter adhesin